MVPDNITITRGLADVVRRAYHGPDREDLTVNYARRQVEESLGLEAGFLRREDWKVKSRRIIMDALKELEAADAESSSPQRASPTRRPKSASSVSHKSYTAGGGASKETESHFGAASGAGDLSEGEFASSPPPKKRKVAKSTKKKIVESEVEEELSAHSNSGSDRSGVSGGPAATSDPEDVPNPAAAEDESEVSDVIDEPPKRKQKAKAKATSKPKPTDTAGDSSSELSSVVDEGPPTKRKRGTTKTQKATAASKATAANSPEEAQIKLLQSQLAKCGVRKVWGAEFKKHGADGGKAKVKYLKDMLSEVGMSGRFSEARAREIKEARELQADLQDVMQGEKSWGVSGGGRGTRRRAAAAAAGKGRALKEESDEEDVEDDKSDEDEESEAGSEAGSDAGTEAGSEDSEEDGGAKLAVRGKGPAKRRADLAFLGDDSESE
ncbi:uncharacterized protein C8A04DRAFT_28923 [Dichotomopilus funicola]|uniref:Transcriptional regulator n=1 Tax=Dichotomopilus funicola TaxID=1934379 RepID=A0AAN6V266_9PEZI|nr:hypothetical protein C8A04DRAFT_28923 [Dichotomopilus funicola]